MSIDHGSQRYGTSALTVDTLSAGSYRRPSKGARVRTPAQSDQRPSGFSGPSISLSTVEISTASQFRTTITSRYFNPMTSPFTLHSEGNEVSQGGIDKALN